MQEADAAARKFERGDKAKKVGSTFDPTTPRAYIPPGQACFMP
jgi:hypothetical protein